MKIIYFGTPAFSSDVLAYLLSHDIEIVARTCFVVQSSIHCELDIS